MFQPSGEEVELATTRIAWNCDKKRFKNPKQWDQLMDHFSLPKRPSLKSIVIFLIPYKFTHPDYKLQIQTKQNGMTNKRLSF